MKSLPVPEVVLLPDKPTMVNVQPPDKKEVSFSYVEDTSNLKDPPDINISSYFNSSSSRKVAKSILKEKTLAISINLSNSNAPPEKNKLNRLLVHLIPN